MSYSISVGARFPTNLLSTGLLCFLAVCGPVWAESTQCTPITSLPATITTQGIYCLTGNLVTKFFSPI